MEKETLEQLYQQATGGQVHSVTAVAQAGSSRKYYRLDGDGGTLIGTVGSDCAENEAFVYLSNHLKAAGLPVPEVKGVSNDRLAYVQTDLGDTSLYNLIERGDASLDAMLDKTIRTLADFHRKAAEGLDFNRCFPLPSMDEQAVMWDLNYFKYCFLKAHLEDFSEPLLEKGFKRLAESLTSHIDDKGVFMLRDFQSRNVMIAGGKPYVIDFQGGRRGMPHYDVASFLWQARAGFTPEQRERLIDVYTEAAGIDGGEFRRELPLFVLLRLMQVLGAYGFRGYFQQKQTFIMAVPKALSMLGEVTRQIPDELSYLRDTLCRLCEKVSGDEPEAFDGLTVEVTSFSYRKGVPRDISGNGGGFVFDCRSLHNPGRYEQYKQLTGRDKVVIDFLESNSDVADFLLNVEQLVDASVERYLKRGFSHLQVNFGCTGGRHRSVYCAEHLARHLAQRAYVRVRLVHREQGINSIIPPQQ